MSRYDHFYGNNVLGNIGNFFLFNKLLLRSDKNPYSPHFLPFSELGGGRKEFLKISKGGRDVLIWWDGKVECSG